MDTNTTQQPPTDVVPDKTNIGRMVNTAWHVLSAGLFPSQMNAEPSKAMACGFIQSFLSRTENGYASFAEFCQRILMVRHYQQNHPRFGMHHKLNSWLDPANKLGFAGTEKWFANLKENRALHPVHLIELKAFPEAILELAEDPTPDIFHYWNDWFIEKKAMDIQRMFMMVGGCLAFRNYEELKS